MGRRKSRCRGDFLFHTARRNRRMTMKLRPILLVEDNLNDVELTIGALKRNNLTNEIVIARHGGEALDFLHRRGSFQNRPAVDPVVVFLDLKMPKVDGVEVLRQMKEDAA